MATLPGGDDDEIGYINITPMVDVLLVLLVIFMVTANFLKQESVNINLPKVNASDPNVAKSVQIALTKDGKLLMEGLDTTEEKMVGYLARESKYRPNMRVTLSADERLSYGRIARAMGLIRQSGVTRIAPSVKREGERTVHGTTFHNRNTRMGPPHGPLHPLPDILDHTARRGLRGLLHLQPPRIHRRRQRVRR